ncbi:MAG TPA: hypothetical protein VD864_09435, partial [Nocardioides sp.]|nr:hypothetical protein [Nocardioides sp.]
MTADNWGALVLVLLACALLCALGSWARAARRIWAPAALLVLLGAGIVAAVPPDVDLDGRGLTATLVLLAGALAIAGGGPVTALVFDLVDRRETPADSMQTAGRVLRGGAWIGALERGAILASLVAGWPEGLAVVLAVKGLGRYPELRA